MSASIGLSAASEKSREFPAFQNTQSATVPGRGNAFCLRHVGDARHVGDGAVFPVFIWIRNNRIGASQLGARQPIRTSVSETKEAVYRPMHGASRGVEQTIWDPFLKKDKQALDKIRNRATRWVSGVKRYQPASVTKLHHQLKWPTLQQWRKRQRLSGMRKIMNGDVGITKDMLSLEDSDSRTWKKHHHKLKTKSGRTTELKNSFVNCSIPEWNLRRELETERKKTQQLENYKRALENDKRTLQEVAEDKATRINVLEHQLRAERQKYTEQQVEAASAPVAEAASADIFKRQLAAHLP